MATNSCMVFAMGTSPIRTRLYYMHFWTSFCSFDRVNLFSEKIPRKMVLQIYNLLHAMSNNDRDCDFYHRLDHLLKEHTAALLNCIDTSLHSNREVLEAIAGSLHSGDRIEREASMKQVVDLDTVIEFCVQAGLALAFDGLLAEAAGAVLEEGAPLIYSLLAEVVKHVPDEIPEKKEIRRLKGVANSVGVVCDHDSQWVRSVLEEVGGANDGSWSLLPYLFATFMASNVWNTTAFNVETGGFNNNINCLARCISAVIAGSEFVRLEPERQQRRSFSNGHVDETLDSEIQSRLSAEASIKSTLQLFVKFSAGIILDSWSETNRSHLVAQVIFLDQLCDISPYLPRSSLELHIPYAILRSIYSQYYTNNPSTLLALLTVSPRHSPAVSLSHASPVIRQGRGDSTPQYLSLMIQAILNQHHHHIVRSTFMIMTVETFGGMKTNTGMYAGLGHWITAQVVK